MINQLHRAIQLIKMGGYQGAETVLESALADANEIVESEVKLKSLLHEKVQSLDYWQKRAALAEKALEAKESDLRGANALVSSLRELNRRHLVEIETLQRKYGEALKNES